MIVLRFVFIVCLIVLFVSVGGLSLRIEQSKHVSPLFRVWLNVNGPEDLASAIRNYTNEGLQGLPDVEVAEDYPWRYELHIVAIRGGAKLKNISLAIAALRIFDNSGFTENSFRYLTDGLYENIQLAVVSGQKGDLRKMCQEVVTRFDSHVLEPERVK